MWESLLVRPAFRMVAGGDESDAGRIVLRLLESGERPLRSVLNAVDKSASRKAKQLMEQLESQLRVICVPGRSGKSISGEILDVARICASSLRKVLEVQKSDKLVGLLPSASVPPNLDRTCCY